MKCTILYCDPKEPTKWRSPTSLLRARLVAPGFPAILRGLEADEDGAMPELLPFEDGCPPNLWLGGTNQGIRLDFDASLLIWRVELTTEAAAAFETSAIIAAMPEDLGGKLALFTFTDAKDATFLYGGSWLSTTLAELLESSTDADLDREGRRQVWEILTSRARGEAEFATIRAARLEKKAGEVAKNHFFYAEASE